MQTWAAPIDIKSKRIINLNITRGPLDHTFILIITARGADDDGLYVENHSLKASSHTRNVFKSK